MNTPVILAGLVLFIVSVFVRSVARLAHRDFGIDTWYYLLYAESLRRHKRLPARVPFYLLDEDEQFYPPGFPILLSLFSPAALEKFHWLINPAIDSLHLLALYFIAFFLSGNMAISVFTALLYLSSPILVTQSSNLNSRMFGSLLLTLVMVSAYVYLRSHIFTWFILCILSGVILAFSHKMTMQQFVVLAFGSGIIYRSPAYPLIFLVIFLAAILAGRKFYLGVLNAHAQIIKFWSKNIPFIGVHPVYDSELYRKSGKAEEKKCVKGLRSSKFYFTLERARIAFVFIAAVWIFVLSKGASGPNAEAVFYWIVLNYLTVFATSYLPFFKNFGEGYKYLTYGIFPVSLFLGIYTFTALSFPYPFILLSGILAMNIAVSSYIIKMQSRNFLAQTDEPLFRIFSFLKGLRRDNVMCLPFSKADALAYFCRKRVLFGGHNLGWEKLDDFWPVLKKPLEYFIGRYAISYILIDDRFVDLPDLNLKVEYAVLRKEGNYALLEMRGKEGE